MNRTVGDGAPLIRLRDWSVTRRGPDGERTLLTGLDLTIHRGEWVALLGCNGSGKTSLLRYLAGGDAPVDGRVRLMAQDPDEQLVTASVRDELALCGLTGAVADARLAEAGLADLAGVDPLLLSAGQKQRLQLVTALADGPDLLLADEPTALQDPPQAAWLLERLQRWRSAGGALLMACQDPRELEAADRLLLLESGRVALAGPVPDLCGHPAVRELLARPETAAGEAAGGPPTAAGGADSPSGAAAPVVAAWRDLSCAPGGRPLFAGVNLVIRAGERHGIIGPSGCGKSTLLGAAAGLHRPRRGSVTVVGRVLYAGGDTDLDHGVALLAPQFPEYVFTRRSIAAEAALDPALRATTPADLLASAGLPPGYEDRDPRDLSTGQRRRLALSLVLRSRRPLLLLDEPTAALDAAGRRQVQDLLADAVDDATAVVIASHDEGFLRACGCRIHRLGAGGLREGPRSGPGGG
ncbi:MAG: ATP-binding cassette domain-containing protein [Candidatus Krumholzibacteriia bacterium]